MLREAGRVPTRLWRSGSRLSDWKYWQPQRTSRLLLETLESLESLLSCLRPSLRERPLVSIYRLRILTAAPSARTARLATAPHRATLSAHVPAKNTRCILAPLLLLANLIMRQRFGNTGNWVHSCVRNTRVNRQINVWEFFIDKINRSIPRNLLSSQ